MADNLKQNISELIDLIRYAQEKESVTNEMVAEILDYLNRVIESTTDDCVQLRHDLEQLSATLTDSLNRMKHAVDDAQSKAGNALGDAIIAIQKAEAAAKAAENAGEAAASLRSSIGMPGGIAPVGSDGKIPAEYLPKSSSSGGNESGDNSCNCGEPVKEFNGIHDNVPADIIRLTIAPVYSSNPGYIVLYSSTHKRFLLGRLYGHELQVITAYYNNWIGAETFGIPSSSDGCCPVGGKIYVDTVTDRIFRWDGNDLVPLSAASGSTATDAEAITAEEINNLFKGGEAAV